MAIAYVATAQIYSGSDDPVSGSINLGSTSGRAVMVHITVGDSYTVTGVSITGGTALTLIDSGTFSSGAYAKRYVYAGVVTETGAQTITVTTDAGGGTRYGTVAAYSGVASIRGGISGSNNADPNAQPSLTVTTVSGDTVVLLGHDGERGITFTPGSGATERFDTGGAYVQDETASGTSTAATGTMSAPGYWSAGAVVLVPEGGGGSFTLTADQGSFALTGQTVGLLFNRSLTADQGAYALTGQDVTLTKATPGAFVLTADAGQYLWTGEDALADYAMNGEQGSYALSGQDVTFTRGFPQAYTLTADAGSYTFNGQNARLDWSGAPVVPNRQAGIYMGMRIGL